MLFTFIVIQERIQEQVTGLSCCGF